MIDRARFQTVFTLFLKLETAVLAFSNLSITVLSHY